MRKNKLFLLLALLLTAATGAWADETPLVTIENKGNTSFTSGSKTFDDKVTVTFSVEVYNDGDEDGWYAGGTGSLLTVAGTNGYTITSCKFYTKEGDALTGYTVVGESPSVYLSGGMVFTDNSKTVYIGAPGINKIEVFGTAAASGYTVSMKDGVKDADKWTVKVGEGQAQALPIGGLTGDGSETVTLQYTGRLKVKGVKATSDAADAEATYTLLSAATTADCGKVVCAAGHLHDAKTAVPDGCTAVGILGKVTETGHGLILALQDAAQQNWNTIDGWTSVTTYAGTTLKVLPDDAARGTNLTSYTALGSTAVSNWAVAQKSDYEAIFTNLGSTKGDSDGTTYDNNVNAYITEGVGGTAISGRYWSATERSDAAWDFFSNCWASNSKTSNYNVRPVLGFGGEAGDAEPEEATPALSITSPSVGQVIGSDGKNYAYGSLPTGVTAVAKICYVSGSNGLALALTDEGTLDWSTAIETCAAHTPAFTGGTWKLATQDEWNNMITTAGNQTDLRDGFSSVGGTNMEENCYWTSSEVDSDFAWLYYFGNGQGYTIDDEKDVGYYVRACLAF